MFFYNYEIKQDYLLNITEFIVIKVEIGLQIQSGVFAAISTYANFSLVKITRGVFKDSIKHL